MPLPLLAQLNLANLIDMIKWSQNIGYYRDIIGKYHVDSIATATPMCVYILRLVDFSDLTRVVGGVTD